MTRQMLGDAEWAALKDKLQAIGRIWKHGDEGRNRRFLAGVASLLRIGLALLTCRLNVATAMR